MSASYSGIYAIYFTGGRGRYVGSTRNFKDRLRRHLRRLRLGDHHSIALQRAYNKYGEGKLRVMVLEHCPEDQLLTREQYWMGQFSILYNAGPVAGSRRGAKLTEAQRKRISDAQKRRFEDPVARAELRQAILHTVQRADIREKMSLAAKKRWADPAEREKQAIRTKNFRRSMG